MQKSEDVFVGVCCFLIIVIAGIYLLWYYYGSLPLVVLGTAFAGIVILLFYSQRKTKKTKEELERQKLLRALEERLKEERFEEEQKAKGLVKYVDRHGNVRWGTPEQIIEWEREDKAQREVIIQREIVKIQCRYCGNLYDARLDKCPHCGAGR